MSTFAGTLPSGPWVSMRAFLVRLLLACIAAFPSTVKCAEAGPYHDKHIIAPVLVDSAYSVHATLEKEPKRLVAAALTVTLGAFGAHRLYLGTGVKVPLVYGLTFGGFGVLVLIDLGEILFTKDLGPYEGNTKVFMWSKGRSATTTPP